MLPCRQGGGGRELCGRATTVHVLPHKLYKRQLSGLPASMARLQRRVRPGRGDRRGDAAGADEGSRPRRR